MKLRASKYRIFSIYFCFNFIGVLLTSFLLSVGTLNLNIVNVIEFSLVFSLIISFINTFFDDYNLQIDENGSLKFISFRKGRLWQNKRVSISREIINIQKSTKFSYFNLIKIYDNKGVCISIFKPFFTKGNQTVIQANVDKIMSISQ